MLLKDKRIFIVEDNVGNRAIMQILLEQQGAKVGIERWGSDTVARLRSFAPVDLILLDLMLGHDASGFDVFARIRAVPEFTSVPAVAVSAMDASVAIPQARSHGLAGFIGKPVDYDLFPKQVAAILNGEAVWYTR